VTRCPSIDSLLLDLNWAELANEAAMTLDYNVLETYDNKTAAALAAYALSAAEEKALQALGYSGSTEAFKELGSVFGVKRNTIKNFRDSFDPHTGSHRAGWHQYETLRPTYLNSVLEYGKTLDDTVLLAKVETLRSWIWLSDLQEDWAECDDDLSTVTQTAELDTPAEIMRRIASFLTSQGLVIQDIGRTAIALSSKQRKQQSILSMAYLPKFKAIMPYVLSVIKYKEAADNIRDDLFGAFPSAANDQQRLFNAIRDSSFRKDDFFSVAKPKVGSDVSVERLYRAFVEPEWGGFNKSIFRSKSDVLVSVCQDRLNLENVKTGYVGHIVDYLLATQDSLEELTLPRSQGSVADPAAIAPQDAPRNVLFFGAPGTGKSHNAESYVACDANHFHRTVFFADYQNSDFVGGIKPIAKSGSVSYRFEPGPLTLALTDALQNQNQNVVLLIEEINRGNAPAIFGEMFHLLDRASDGASKYPIKASESLKAYLSESLGEENAGLVKFPSNLYIVATMNAGDQGVFPLDTAFKRRWHFKYMPIDFDRDYGIDGFVEEKISLRTGACSWSSFARAVNEILTVAGNVPEDRLLGPFFLSPSELGATDLKDTISEKVLPYLWEDVLRYDDRTLLFDSEVLSFTELQTKFKAEEVVFSDNFNLKLEAYRTASSEASEQEPFGETELETVVSDENTAEVLSANSESEAI